MKDISPFRLATQITDQTRTGNTPTPTLQRNMGSNEFFPVTNRKKLTEITRAETVVLDAGRELLDSQRRYMETGIEWVRTYAKTQQLPEILANDRANLRHGFDMDSRRREVEREMRPALLRASYDQDLHAVRVEIAKLKAEEAGWRREQALQDVQTEEYQQASDTPENQSPISDLGALLQDAENLDVSSDQTRELVHKLRIALERQTVFAPKV